MNLKADCLWPGATLLGEGPCWSADEQALWFVDIKQLRLHRYHVPTGAMRHWDTPAQPGFVMPVRGGGFFVGLQSGLHRFDPATGRFTLHAVIEAPELGNRLNDATVDAAGRLWFGSMHDGESAQSGALYRLGRDGQPVRIEGGYCITNGPATSADGRTFYHTDSVAQVIYAFDVDADGMLGNKRELIRTAPDVYPDGTCVDAEGCLWVGLWNGWAMQRYSPAGEPLERIELPCANVTKGVLGGDDLRTLYITTARKGLAADALAAQPLAGGLFSARVACAGLPQHEVVLD